MGAGIDPARHIFISAATTAPLPECSCFFFCRAARRPATRSSEPSACRPSWTASPTCRSRHGAAHVRRARSPLHGSCCRLAAGQRVQRVHGPVAPVARLQRGSRQLVCVLGGRAEPFFGLGRCLGVPVSSGPLSSTSGPKGDGVRRCIAAVLQYSTTTRGHRDREMYCPIQQLYSTNSLQPTLQHRPLVPPRTRWCAWPYGGLDGSQWLPSHILGVAHGAHLTGPARFGSDRPIRSRPRPSPKTAIRLI